MHSVVRFFMFNIFSQLFQEIVLENKSQHRSLKLSIATNVDEDILDTMFESISFYKTPVSIKVSSESQHFEQLNLMWLLLSHSNIDELANNKVRTQWKMPCLINKMYCRVLARMSIVRSE